MRPFWCPVTILNTLDHLGKFDGKAGEGFFIGYSVNSKAFRLFNNIPRIVEENLHITFLKNKPNVAGSGLEWLFDIDTLTQSMNYKPVVAGNQTNGNAGTKESIDACQAGKKIDSPDDGFKPSGEEEKKDLEDPENEDSEVLSTEEPRVNQENDENVNSTNNINTVSSTVNTASIMDNVVDENIVYGCVDDPNMPNLEEIVYSDDDADFVAEGDMNNLEFSMPVRPIATTRVHKDHLVEHIIEDVHLARQTRRMTKSVTEHAIGTKWMYRNKKDGRGIVIKNKVRLVTQGYTQEEGIDYDEMDVKSEFLYDKIEEEVYVCQPPGFEDPKFPDRVYKVEKALYGLHQDTRAWYETLSTYLLDNGFQRGIIDKTLFIKKVKGELTFFFGLQVTQKDDGIFISQEKYVDEILKKFGFSTVKTTSTPLENSKPLMKDENAKDVDVHLYRSMIGSLMYLTSSRPDIMFAVYACARFQVTPKVLHLHAVKIIFRYLKGQPKLGLWYLKDSPFDLEAYTDSDYAGVSLDRKSITRGKVNCVKMQWIIHKEWLEWSAKAAKDKIEVKTGNSKVNVVGHYLVLLGEITTAEEGLKFVDSHNMVAYLEKSIEDADFDEIVDFLNASPIRYALTSSGPTTLVADETVYEEKGDSMEMAATTAASFDADGPRRQDTIIRDRPAQTRFERLSKQSNDPPLSGVNTLGSGEDKLKIIELMEICTKLSNRVLALDNVKTAQDLEITSLKKREDASKQGRNIAESDQDEGISFVQKDAKTQGRYDHDLDVTTVDAPITTVGVSVSTTEPSTPPTTTIIIEDEDLTIAQILMKMRKVELEEEERVTIQREEEANLISSDNTQAIMEAYYELAQRLQAEEQGELTIEERSKLFVELINKRKKHFAKLRAKEIRRKPPTKA
ncbi:putative ribonuclease H-like domain-containing protein [Tanacetum coccineum]